MEHKEDGAEHQESVSVRSCDQALARGGGHSDQDSFVLVPSL